MRTPFFLAAIGILACTSCDRNERADQNRQPPNQENSFNFNPKNLITYRGQILQTLNIFDPSTSSDTVGILMETEKGTIPVILGPKCFISGGPQLLQGQQIEVTGSETYMDGSILVIASEARVQGYTLKLRNKDGNPLWSGWHRQ